MIIINTVSKEQVGLHEYRIIMRYHLHLQLSSHESLLMFFLLVSCFDRA